MTGPGVDTRYKIHLSYLRYVSRCLYFRYYPALVVTSSVTANHESAATKRSVLPPATSVEAFDRTGVISSAVDLAADALSTRPPARNVALPYGHSRQSYRLVVEVARLFIFNGALSLHCDSVYKGIKLCFTKTRYFYFFP